MKRFGLADGFMMMSVALLLQHRYIVVSSQTVADQHTREVSAEQFGKDATSTALIDHIKGALSIGENPQPPAWAANPPAGLIAMNHPCLAHCFSDSVVLGLDFGSESIECLREPAGTQLQTEAITQNGTGFSHRKALGLVQISRQGQGSGPELDAGGSGGQ